MWTHFLALARSRAISNGIPLPLRWSEIDAYARLTRNPLTSWELHVITTIDDVWLEIASKQNVTHDDLVEPETAADDAME